MCSFKLCLSRYIVTADEENSRVAVDEESDGGLGHRRTGRVGRDRTTLHQHFDVRLDVCVEGYLPKTSEPSFCGGFPNV